MRKTRIWCLRTKTENLYKVQTLKNLQQQLDYSANFPDFITPCPQEALSLLIAGFSEGLWQVLLTASASEEVLWLHLAFVLCEETLQSLCSGKHSSAASFQQCQWVCRLFLNLSSYPLFPQLPNSRSSQELREIHCRNSEALVPLTALILPSEEWRLDVYLQPESQKDA